MDSNVRSSFEELRDKFEEAATHHPAVTHRLMKVPQSRRELLTDLDLSKLEQPLEAGPATVYRMAAYVCDKRGRRLVAPKPCYDIAGDPIRNSAGDYVEVREALIRKSIYRGEQTAVRHFRTLAVEAGDRLLDLPGEVRGILADETIRASDEVQRWVWALYDLAWQLDDNSRLKATHIDWIPEGDCAEIQNLFAASACAIGILLNSDNQSRPTQALKSSKMTYRTICARPKNIESTVLSIVERCSDPIAALTRSAHDVLEPTALDAYEAYAVTRRFQPRGGGISDSDLLFRTERNLNENGLAVPPYFERILHDILRNLSDRIERLSGEDSEYEDIEGRIVRNEFAWRLKRVARQRAATNAGAPEELSQNCPGFSAASELSLDHGIAPSRLSEAAGDKKVRTKRAPEGMKDREGRQVRILYNKRDALRQLSPNRRRTRASPKHRSVDS